MVGHSWLKWLCGRDGNMTHGLFFFPRSSATLTEALEHHSQFERETFLIKTNQAVIDLHTVFPNICPFCNSVCLSRNVIDQLFLSS